MRETRNLKVRNAVLMLAVVAFGLVAGVSMANYLGSGDFPTRFLNWRFFGTTSANGSYTSPASSAFSRWTSTTDLSFTQVSNNSWDIALYVAGFGFTGWSGLADIRNSAGVSVLSNFNVVNQTYSYCIANINRSYNDFQGFSARQNVMMHEAGHCVSLAHRNVRSSIMWPSQQTITNPNSTDRSLINARY